MIHRLWLELPIYQTNFHDPKDVELKYDRSSIKKKKKKKKMVFFLFLHKNLWALIRTALMRGFKE